VKLRVNPSTGRLAERIAADSAYADGSVADGDRWLTYRFEPGSGLAVELLSDVDVADWPEVVLAPKPVDPEFAYVLACTTCEPHPLTTDVHERARLADAHGDNDHRTDLYAVRLSHPDRDEDDATPTFSADDMVTFHGSREGESADLVEATVAETITMPDSEGEPVDGYVVHVDGRALFVPTTALNAA
jgi:hypothetical protein